MKNARALAIFWPSWVLVVLLYVALIFMSQGQDILRTTTENCWQLMWSSLALVFASITVWYSSRLYGFTQLKVLNEAPLISHNLLRFLSYSTYTVVILGVLKLDDKTNFSNHFTLFPMGDVNPTRQTLFSTLIIFIVSMALYYGIRKGCDKLKLTCRNYKQCKNMLLLFFFLVLLGVVIPVLYTETFTLIAGLVLSQISLAVMLQMRGHWTEILMFQKASKSDKTGDTQKLRFPKAQAFWHKLLLRIRRSIMNSNKGGDKAQIIDALNSFDNNLVYNNIYTSVALLSALAMTLANYSIWVAGAGGSLTWILIGLSGIAGTINVVRAFGRAIGIRLIGPMLIVILFMGLISDPHALRTVSEEYVEEVTRLTFQQQLEKWNLQCSVPLKDGNKPLIFVMADGGALRSGYWTSEIYSQLDSLCSEPFGNKVFCFSGASGGSTGNAIYYSALQSNLDQPGEIAKEILHQDLFSHTVARMLGNDALNMFLPFFPDRGSGLEDALFDAAYRANNNLLLNAPFEHFVPQDPSKWSPILTMNTTRIQDAAPALISTMDISRSSGLDHRVDVLAEKDPSNQHLFSSMAVLGSRFPYVSPAGAIQRSGKGNQKDYYVDGGYMDNSGAGIVLEMIMQLDSLKASSDALTREKYKKITP
ncbi:MAG: hypothetical protein ACPGWM_06380, partial [Flavobacteriales bacterium]